jgi:hypothetical protein
MILLQFLTNLMRILVILPDIEDDFCVNKLLIIVLSSNVVQLNQVVVCREFC